MRNKTFMAFGFLFALIWMTSFTLACSCVALPETQDRFDNAGIVFSGIAESIISMEGYPTIQKTTFQVEDYWKLGELTGEKSIELESYEDDGANCGFTFEEGEKYIVYAYVDLETGKLTTNSCMQTTVFDEEESTKLDSLATPMQPLSGGVEEEMQEEENIFTRFFNWLKSLF